MKNILLLLLIFIVNIIYCNEEEWVNLYSNMNKIELVKNELSIIKLENTYEKYTKLGIIYHFLSSNGEKSAQKSIYYFNKALELNDNYLVRAYLGSAYTLLGDESNNPIKKINSVNKGIKIMDEVYNLNPNDYMVTVLIVSNCLELPNFIFHRLKLAIKLVDKLYDKINSYDYNKQAEIIFLKAMTLKLQNKKEEALKLFKIIIKDYSDSNYVELSKEKIKEI